jgi:hypothetical protein
MKTSRILMAILLSAGGAFNSFAQQDLKFEVNKVLPFAPIQENQLAAINTIADLDKRYPAGWVKEYISVDISAFKSGIKTIASGTSNVLNQAQKDLIQSADRNSDIAVSVKYLPENSLINNNVKQYDFKVTVMPDNNAAYGEGAAQLTQYLYKNSIANIEAGSFTGYDLAAVKFTVTEQGHIADVQVALPSGDTKIDGMLVSAVSKMTGWKPAAFSNGLKVRQSFVLTVGNMANCMVNLLNIRPKE